MEKNFEGIFVAWQVNGTLTACVNTLKTICEFQCSQVTSFVLNSFTKFKLQQLPALVLFF
jgi:hypothetical protein